MNKWEILPLRTIQEWGLKERGDKQRNQSSLVLRATKGEGNKKK